MTRDWPQVGARRPGWMDEPEVLREREAEKWDAIFTEWEWERDKLANLTSEGD